METLHSCVNVEQLQIHFNFAGLRTCLYSTGTGSALRVMFQVEDRTVLVVIGRDELCRLCRCRVIPASHVVNDDEVIVV